jgi:hypothetical protein
LRRARHHASTPSAPPGSIAAYLRQSVKESASTSALFADSETLETLERELIAPTLAAHFAHVPSATVRAAARFALQLALSALNQQTASAKASRELQKPVRAAVLGAMKQVFPDRPEVFAPLVRELAYCVAP